MYLTLKHLVDRYGADEIVAVTNDRTTGVVTPQQLRDYVEGNDPNPSDDVKLIESIVNERIEDAEAYVLSFVHNTYNIAGFSEDDAPKDLRAVTAQVARYFLHENRMNQRVHQGFQDAQVWLNSRPNVGANKLGKKTKQAGVGVLTNVKHKGSRIFSEENESRYTEGYS